MMTTAFPSRFWPGVLLETFTMTFRPHLGYHLTASLAILGTHHFADFRCVNDSPDGRDVFAHASMSPVFSIEEATWIASEMKQQGWDGSLSSSNIRANRDDRFEPSPHLHWPGRKSIQQQ
jgi:hypothetical protein